MNIIKSTHSAHQKTLFAPENKQQFRATPITFLIAYDSICSKSWMCANKNFFNRHTNWLIFKALWFTVLWVDGMLSIIISVAWQCDTVWKLFCETNSDKYDNKTIYLSHWTNQSHALKSNTLKSLNDFVNKVRSTAQMICRWEQSEKNTRLSPMTT